MPLAGGVMGYYLDVYFRTSPKLTVAMTILGLIGAAIAVVRIAREFSSRSNDGQ